MIELCARDGLKQIFSTKPEPTKLIDTKLTPEAANKQSWVTEEIKLAFCNYHVNNLGCVCS